MQSFPRYTPCPFSIPLKDDIADTEKPDAICSPTFVVNNFEDNFYIHQSFPLNIQDLHK